MKFFESIILLIESKEQYRKKLLSVSKNVKGKDAYIFKSYLAMLNANDFYYDLTSLYKEIDVFTKLVKGQNLFKKKPKSNKPSKQEMIDWVEDILSKLEN